MNIHSAKTIANLFKAEGFASVFRYSWKRIARKIATCHLLVFSTKEGSQSLSGDFGETKCVTKDGFCIKEIFPGDESEIAKLTEIDPWQIPKSVTVENLEEGWRCFVVLQGDTVLASSWFWVGSDFKDSYLGRVFRLNPYEAYLYRGVTSQRFRGLGLFPWLVDNAMRHLALSTGITRCLALVRDENESSKRAFAKIGWKIVGRVGFIEIFDLRFHYLWGRNAFSGTRNRFIVTYKS